jgi:hypothetical protein
MLIGLPTIIGVESTVLRSIVITAMVSGQPPSTSWSCDRITVEADFAVVPSPGGSLPTSW